MRNAVLNEGLLEIGAAAFHGCTSLQRITLPSTITDLDDSFLRGCTNLSEIQLGDKLQKIDESMQVIMQYHTSFKDY